MGHHLGVGLEVFMLLLRGFEEHGIQLASHDATAAERIAIALSYLRKSLSINWIGEEFKKSNEFVLL